MYIEKKICILKKKNELNWISFMCVYVNVRNGFCYKYRNVKMCIIDYSLNFCYFVLYKLCERKWLD